MTRGEKAKENFLKGYNCTQSVLLSFDDVIDKDKLSFLMSSTSCFGGGMGRLREVCGTVSGMFIVLSYFFGYSGPEENEKKPLLYGYIQELAKRFEKETGSIVCRELLGLDHKRDNPTPDARDHAYYSKRPCPELCRLAADTVEGFLVEKGVITASCEDE